MSTAQIKYPFGAADTVALTATGAQAVTIDNNLTIIDGVTVQATGNRTINLTISSELKAGAVILCQLKTQGTETTTFGTGIDAATITGVAGKTINQSFMYNGTAFVAMGANHQID